MDNQKKKPHIRGEEYTFRRKVWRSKDELDLEQAFSDWFGTSRDESETSGIRPMDTIISEVLAKLPLNTPGIDPEVLRAGWRAAAGDFIGGHAELVSISKGVATIHVLQPAMRYHLTQWKSALLEKLRKQFGEDSVTSIRFRIG